MRPPGRRVPMIEHEHICTPEYNSEEEYDIQQLIDEDQDLAQQEMPPPESEINIDADLATNKYLTTTQTGTTTIDIDEATTTQQGVPPDNGDGTMDQHDREHDSEEDYDTLEQDNTIALNTMPGKRRRVTTSARWENNALRQFKRRFDDDAEREESVAWEREVHQESVAWKRARQRVATGSGTSAGVTGDRENECTRTGVT